MSEKNVSHYRILEPLGEGGMGVVYKAEDTRLKRTVALKFLSRELTGGGDHAARFLREAQAAAALDHPNICTVYEIGEEDGRAFLAMAFLEGETLDRKVARGPLSLEAAAEIARQAAEGLAAAHRAGVVHRDVKSANIMVTEDHAARLSAKLLDFGLARVGGAPNLTQTDMRLGTVAYMAPEQALGEEVDRRSDIWSLGVVLYEMVAGSLPFQGHYDQALVYSILNEEAEPLTSLRARVPLELEWIVDKCLAKSPADRYQDCRELIVDLERFQRKAAGGKTAIQLVPSSQIAPPEEPSAAPEPVADFSGAMRALPWRAWLGRLAARWPLAGGVCAVVAAGFVAGLLVARGTVPEAEAVVRRFTLRPVEAIQGDQQIGHLAISPDGRHLAFSTTGSGGTLWLQPLDRHEPVQLEGVRGVRDVFWSPDSDFVGFATRSAVGKFALQGHSLTVLVEDIPTGNLTASWSADGESIVFVQLGGLPMQVSALGGVPRPLVAAVPRRRALVGHPSLLEAPDGQQILLYSERALDGDRVMARRVRDGQAGEPVQLVEGNAPVYAPTGHVLFQPSSMNSALWAIRFSLRDLATAGEPFLVAQNASDPSVSVDGTLAHLDNPNAQQRQLVWVDRSGAQVAEIGKSQPWVRGPRVSPPGDKVLAAGGSGREFDLWIHEAERPVLSRLSFDEAEETSAIWAPDGLRVALTHRGSPDLRVLTVGGGAPAETIFTSEDGPFVLLDWSRDGRYILFQERGRPGGWSGAAAPPPKMGRAGGPGESGLGYLEFLASEGRWEAREFLPSGPYIVDEAVFSPDGRYVAYESNESGEMEVYVRPFPTGVERWQLTTQGGRQARWSRSGNEIYFVRDEVLHAVQVETEGGFRAGLASPLFERTGLGQVRRFRAYDVGPDGRFAVVGSAGGRQLPAIRVVLKWFAEFPGR